MRKIVVPALLTVVVSLVLMTLFLRIDLTPVLASRQGEPIDGLIRLLFAIAAVIFALCMVFLVYSIAAFRRRPGDLEDAAPVEGSVPLEITWTVIPLVIVLGIGAYSARILFNISAPPEAGQEMVVRVTGFRWGWDFEYPESGVTSSELVLPVDRPVLFLVRTKDVIHSFYVPEFRLKIDAIPGVENQVRITPTQIGEFKVRCAEICGTGHAYMLAPARVVEPEAFQAWLDAQRPAAGAKPSEGETAPLSDLAEKGREYAVSYGCVACHSADGTPRVGPTWKGLAGSTRTLQDGTTVVADEAYLRKSIVVPGVQVVWGFPDIMPRDFGDRMTEEEIQALIAYIESLR